MSEANFNENQTELFSVMNWIIMHSKCTPTEAIQVLSCEIIYLKQGLLMDNGEESDPTD